MWILEPLCLKYQHLRRNTYSTQTDLTRFTGFTSLTSYTFSSVHFEAPHLLELLGHHWSLLQLQPSPGLSSIYFHLRPKLWRQNCFPVYVCVCVGVWVREPVWVSYWMCVCGWVGLLESVLGCVCVWERERERERERDIPLRDFGRRSKGKKSNMTVDLIFRSHHTHTPLKRSRLVSLMDQTRKEKKPRGDWTQTGDFHSVWRTTVTRPATINCPLKLSKFKWQTEQIELVKYTIHYQVLTLCCCQFDQIVKDYMGLGTAQHRGSFCFSKPTVPGSFLSTFMYSSFFS